MNENEFRRVIGENLSAFRKRANLTQADVAARIHYSDKSISKWERGDGVPDVFVLRQLSELYGVTLAELVGERSPAPQPQIVPTEARSTASMSQGVPNETRSTAPVSQDIPTETRSAAPVSQDVSTEVRSPAPQSQDVPNETRSTASVPQGVLGEGSDKLPDDAALRPVESSANGAKGADDPAGGREPKPDPAAADEAKNSETDEPRPHSLFAVCLAVGAVWLAATVGFALPNMMPVRYERTYLAFVYAVPASFVVMELFAVRWRLPAILHLLFGSGILWTVTLSIHLSVRDVENLYLIYIIAAVIQLLGIFGLGRYWEMIRLPEGGWRALFAVRRKSGRHLRRKNRKTADEKED